MADAAKDQPKADAAAAAKAQAEKDRQNRIYVLRKEREYFETVFAQLELTISGWLPGAAAAKFPSKVPTQDELNLTERELEQVLTEQKNKSRSQFLQCHGAEYATDHKDEFDKIFSSLHKALASVQGLRRQHYPAPTPAVSSHVTITTFRERWIFQSLMERSQSGRNSTICSCTK